MGDNSLCHHRQPPVPPSRLTIGGGGEIVEVQGGHIVRSTGRKDRHSKVCTAKGTRDRRVRLSAPTAIQFYDVQDRLGYDRPSKAVDWLIEKARTAIDELEKLPPWHPNTLSSAAVLPEHPLNGMVEAVGASVEDGRAVGGGNECSVLSQNPQNSSSFLPPSIDSDAIADTIKSFFPASPPQFQNYPLDLLSRTISQGQDLPISLQSFQEPIFLHHHEQVLFSEISHLGFDRSPKEASRWPEQHHHSEEISPFQRMLSSWNNAGAGNTGGAATSGGGGSFVFSCSPPPAPLQPLFGGQNQLFSQRGPLQSSNTPSIRAWMDPPPPIAATDHHQFLFQSSISGIGFHIPARIQGEEEEHDGISNKPSSASSDSCH